jgi:hypothetical protein
MADTSEARITDWKVMEIKIRNPGEIIREVGLLRFLWEWDIFIERVPFLKSILLGNLLFLAAAVVLLARRKHG